MVSDIEPIYEQQNTIQLCECIKGYQITLYTYQITLKILILLIQVVLKLSLEINDDQLLVINILQNFFLHIHTYLEQLEGE